MSRFPAILLAALTLGACSVPAVAQRAAESPRGRCASDPVVVVDDAPTRCDVVPPARLDVILTRDSQPRLTAVCEDIGGQSLALGDGRVRCVGVDY